MSEAAPIRDTSKADAVYALAGELLPALRAVARSKGYALAYHGSFARDIDVIAVPWLDRAVDALELAEAIRLEAQRITGHTAFVMNDEKAEPTNYLRRSPEPKPHGRLGWSIHIAGSGTYLDLSVMPAGQAHVDSKVAELERKLEASIDNTLKQSKRAQDAETSLASVRAVRHVRQEDVNGCCVACLAMVTDRSYAEVRAYFIGVGKTFEGEGGGIHEYDAESYLSDHGFAFTRKYRWIGNNRPRPQWPAQSFAPVHILGVRGGGAHAIVLLPDGTVLDPFHAEPRALADYPDVAYMIGVWRLHEHRITEAF